MDPRNLPTPPVPPGLPVDQRISRTTRLDDCGKSLDQPAERDWRETVRDATEMAVLGIVTTVATLPVVTAGAAIATASAAVDHWAEHGRLPDAATTVRRFGRAILPGIGPTVIAAIGALLLFLDVRALVTGAAPGGAALLLVTVVVGIALLGTAGLAVVEVGRHGGRGWLAAARVAIRTGLDRPQQVIACGLALGLATILGTVVPATAPILVGFGLFALHSIARRFGR
jgi:hypothetical protein